ncbi:Zinc finger protein 292 [Oryzias melastigma]|nr:Zinc finger protein 292 [Oryzias melastigma]
MYVLCGSGYERASVGSMAEESTVCDLKGLKNQLEGLLSRYSRDELCSDTERFCSDFCTLVEEHAARFRLPLPQLRVLEIALCYFTRASSCFPANCDPALQTISRLALSVFELLLFFKQEDFSKEPLERFTATFQECHLVLAKHQNLHLLQVQRFFGGGGPWASPVLQGILSQSGLPQHEVDAYIGSELPIFFELRVHFLLSRSRLGEAAALAKRCARHPSAGQHLFFLQVYLTQLHKTSQQDCLHTEVADVSGKDAVHILCSLESEEKDELLLALSSAFLSQQLRRGDMYYLGDLVLVWTNLHSRLKTPPQVFLAECRQLMKSATNVKSIFPFIRAVLQNVGEAGVQFCVELCANALQARLPCDVNTKSLIYKTIAGLLPNDLEVCRACALLVFFQERTVESYKMVYLLYLLPDQEYHVEDGPIRNHVRFETLQVLKKDLLFDPEFWNLITLRTNCLKLMSKKVVSAALEEVMEDKWISKYCAKDPAPRSGCRAKDKSNVLSVAKKRHQNQTGSDAASKRLKTGAGKTRLDDAKRKGGRALQESSPRSLRRSFWQLDRIHGGVALRYEDQRRTTRLSEKNPPKRRIRKPRWLLEDSGALEENLPLRIKRNGLKRGKCLNVLKRSKMGSMKNSAKPLVTSRLRANHQNGFPSVPVTPPSPPQVILELSLPDNELMATFTEDACSRPRGFPQVLFYKPTVKRASAPSPEKTVHGKEVILRARDPSAFVQLLHCYARRQKGKGPSSHAHGSVSTITRSSLQVSPPKDSPRDQAAETGVLKARSSKPPTQKGSGAREATEENVLLQTPTDPQSSSKAETSHTPKPPEAPPISAAKPSEDVEMKVTIASPSPVSDPVSKPQSEEKKPQTTKASEAHHPIRIHVSNAADPVLCGDGEELLRTSPSSPTQVLEKSSTEHEPRDGNNSTARLSDPEVSHDPSLQDRTDVSAQPEGAKEVPELSLERGPPEDSTSGEPETELSSPEEPTPFFASQLQNIKEEDTPHEIGFDGPESSELKETFPESEESRLEYCCIFCEKDFKGCRVVAHAMFHYRRDECMFCGTVFTDDLLAMIHLSDHIEKLKRLKAPPAPDDDAKDSPAKAKTSNASSGSGKRGRPRKSSTSEKRTDSGPSEPRTLRSDDKQSPKQQTPHRVNGHMSKKISRLRRSVDTKEEPVQQEISQEHPGSEAGSSASVGAARKSPFLKEEKKMESAKVRKKPQTDKKSVDPPEKACCPVDGCSWSADISKNRVAPLYHALEEHYGDTRSLEVAFRVGNGKCSICSRVMFSFQHFLHHVGRHRDSPRHPCLHQGCQARFKSGMEMRRHARKHSPLQAVCCLPGCSQLFICLWALNLHEKDHFSARPAKPDKIVQAAAGRKRCSSDDTTENPAASEEPSGKCRQERDESPLREDAEAQKNLCSQEEPELPSVPRLRLRRSSPEAPPSLMLKHLSKVRRKLKKLKTKRRGRPLKASKATKDENAPADRNPSKVETAKSSAADANRLRVTRLRDHRKPPSTTLKLKTQPAKRHKVRNHQTLSNTSEMKTKSDERPAKKLASSAAPHHDAKAPSCDVPPNPPGLTVAEQQSHKILPTTAEKKSQKMLPTVAGKKPQKILPTGVEKKSQKILPTTAEKKSQKILPTTAEKKSQKILPTTTEKKSQKILPTTTEKKSQKIPPTTAEKKSGSKETTKVKEDKEKISAPKKGKLELLHQDDSTEAALSQKDVSSADTSPSAAPQDIQQKEKPATSEKQAEPNKDKSKKKSKDGATPAAIQTESPGGHTPETDMPGSTHTMNGKASAELRKTSVCNKTLALYSKKPYLRVPPTAYLDEKYTAMPKRRKTSFPPPPANETFLEKTSTLAPRQRCAKCFATFTCSEELQTHLQRQNCSTLFGFDSDDEDGHS